MFTPAIALAVCLLTGSSSSASRTSLERDVRVLASPAYEGRMTLSSSMVKAADYLANELRRSGIQPNGDQGTFFHRYELTAGAEPTKNNVLSFRSGDRRLSLIVGEDYMPLFGSAPMKMVDAPSVFVGSGRPEDYEGVDAKGKVVVLLRSNAEGQTDSTGVKGRTAKAQGAVGVVFVGPSSPSGPPLAKIVRGQGVTADGTLVAVQVHERFLKEIAGVTLEKARATKAKQSKALDWTVRVVTEAQPRKGQGINVIGVLPGNDPKLKNELIVVGAHFDHLGYGETGSMSGTDSIHFGADDNASGSAGVLELARVLARDKANRRTVVFQLYSGEELGLLGSAAWVEANPDAVKRTHAMINMDMIGRVREGKVIIYGTNTAAEFPAIAGAIKVDGLKPAPVPTSPGNSDHASFTRMNVPVLFFHSDLHTEYHTERDKPETINYEGMAQVVDAVAQTVRKIDAIDQKLVYTGTPGQGRGGGDPNRTRRVRVGFIPDMSDATGRGLTLNGAVPGSPAEKAGIKKGDRLIMFDGKPVNSAEDLQSVLVGAQPNVTVVVVVERDGNRIELKLTPEAPAQR